MTEQTSSAESSVSTQISPTLDSMPNTPVEPSDVPTPVPSPSPSATPSATPSPLPVPAPAPTEEPAPQPELLLGTLSASDSVAVIDPTITNGSAIVALIPAGRAPWGIDIDAADARGYVATAEGLAVLDLRSRTRISLVPYRHQPGSVEFGEYRRGGLGLVVSPDGASVFVAVSVGAGPAVLEKFDTNSETFTASTEVGARPFDILISADGSEVYTIDHDSFTVSIVDTASMNATSVEVAPFGTVGGLNSWQKPHYAALDPLGRLLLPFQGQAIAVLDPQTRQYEVRSSTANSHQHGTFLTSDERLITVGTGAFGSATGGPNLSIFSLADGTEELVPLQRQHETLTSWTNAETGGQFVVLGGGYTQAGSWDGATVVNLESLQRYEISVPGRPQELIALPASTP